MSPSCVTRIFRPAQFDGHRESLSIGRIFAERAETDLGRHVTFTLVEFGPLRGVCDSHLKRAKCLEGTLFLGLFFYTMQFL